MFPRLAILIYHNPVLHRTYIPTAAFREIGKLKNVVGMKDSHRETRSFIELMAVAPQLRVFVSSRQYYPYSLLGAAGTWSYECWMGPAPLLRLRHAIESQDFEEAIEVIRAITNAVEGTGATDLRWRETAAKIAIHYAGYCEPGPLRAPYVTIPAEVKEAARNRATQWLKINEHYRLSPGD
jgi:dihydrodipicolinate synthase/N-acetylneuraminate lyase